MFIYVGIVTIPTCIAILFAIWCTAGKLSSKYIKSDRLMAASITRVLAVFLIIATIVAGVAINDVRFRYIHPAIITAAMALLMFETAIILVWDWNTIIATAIAGKNMPSLMYVAVWFVITAIMVDTLIFSCEHVFRLKSNISNYWTIEEYEEYHDAYEEWVEAHPGREIEVIKFYGN